MRFKLIITFVKDSDTQEVISVARKAGALGATIINQARGEGAIKKSSFFGLSLNEQRDLILFLVEEHLARNVLETIEKSTQMDVLPGVGIAIQIDVEDAVGVERQISELAETVEEII